MITALTLLQLWVIPGSNAEALGTGDQKFAEIRYAEAEASYTAALVMSADSAEVLWRLVRGRV